MHPSYAKPTFPADSNEGSGEKGMPEPLLRQVMDLQHENPLATNTVEVARRL